MVSCIAARRSGQLSPHTFQRLQQHFVVAFGGATSVPGLEFQGENPWCVLRRSYPAMVVFRYRYLVEGIA